MLKESATAGGTPLSKVILQPLTLGKANKKASARRPMIMAPKTIEVINAIPYKKKRKHP